MKQNVRLNAFASDICLSLQTNVDSVKSVTVSDTTRCTRRKVGPFKLNAAPVAFSEEVDPVTDKAFTGRKDARRPAIDSLSPATAGDNPSRGPSLHGGGDYYSTKTVIRKGKKMSRSRRYRGGGCT
ncbi:hypothetical protein J6590_012032 [Homalodisca vitripennis]|nr:hypothetical protein J6590_012032 [Homalodisca vitripennis]